MSEIHPSTSIDSGAYVGEGVSVGPGAVIGADVRMGDGCQVGANAVIEGPAEIGPGCRIFPGAIIGTEAQYTALEGEGGRVEVGANTVVREGATINRSFKEGGVTRVGEECYLMMQAHVAHDCLLGDRVILTNSTALSGHIEIGSDAFITGFTAIHQFVRIGDGVILSGPTAVRKDVLPYTKTDGNPPEVRGLNTIGLRRMGVTAEIRCHLKRAYRILFQESKTVEEAIGKIEAELPVGREIKTVVDFLRVSERGVYRGGV
ncbi:MAG: acyl-ACP--UDP-N-acetylglucosamine O-acyltransferase [Nitrospinota bacterium]|nr:acyl-ACP--UDP-N-acetylglucosamine O-acyltransferase [Nitrospinota bacterium]